MAIEKRAAGGRRDGRGTARREGGERGDGTEGVGEKDGSRRQEKEMEKEKEKEMAI